MQTCLTAVQNSGVVELSMTIKMKHIDIKMTYFLKNENNVFIDEQ